MIAVAVLILWIFLIIEKFIQDCKVYCLDLTSVFTKLICKKNVLFGLMMANVLYDFVIYSLVKM